MGLGPAAIRFAAVNGQHGGLVRYGHTPLVLLLLCRIIVGIGRVGAARQAPYLGQRRRERVEGARAQITRHVAMDALGDARDK